MSGTSLDGVDAALIRSDGHRITDFGKALTLPYSEDLRRRLRMAVFGHSDISLTMRDMTLAHAEAVQQLLTLSNLAASEVDLLGFHGQSIDHRPEKGITLQIGDPALLAEKTGIDVVADFRRRDVAAGGQGAPLVPLFHAALVEALPKPVAVLNIGGIANVTWVGSHQSSVVSHQLGNLPTEQSKARSVGSGAALAPANNNILAFDTGPGNVLLNEWMGKHTGTHCDTDGLCAETGQVDMEVVQMYLQDPFFRKPAPKSIDRNYFHISLVRHLSIADGAATLTALTAESIQRGAALFPSPARQWIVAGGGRHNPSLMNALRQRIPSLITAEEAGWDGDALEAQAFAFLAIRSYLGLPLSLPTTTGVSRPVTGGALWRA